MIKLQTKIGKSVITFEDVALKNVFKFSALVGGLPEICDVCKSPNIYLSFKSPRGNDYYTLTCKTCGAELSFHQKKEGGFYLKFGEKMQKYQKQSEGLAQPENHQAKPDIDIPDNLDDGEPIPF